jgi:uncharacterized protein YbjT (DUF2867 family)
MATAPLQDWVFHDLRLLDAPAWVDLLEDVDVVVNAAGALQDGPGDDLESVHATMLAHLCGSIRPEMRLVQISAAGASLGASTKFFQSKAIGDAHVQGSSCEWVILRPGLVLAPEAYGGTALLRGTAALPGLLLDVLPDSLIQTVHIEDLTSAVVAAARGDIPTGTIADLTEEVAHSLPELIHQIRDWQGFHKPRLRLQVPLPILTFTGRVADALGRLGWRSPLRTTAITVLQDGIRGDPGPWMTAGGAMPRGLDQTLSALPATRQERLFASLYFALPLAIAVLSIFWLTSGLMALARPAVAAAHLGDSIMPTWTVSATVLGGAFLDIVLGLAILWKPWCRTAALGMMAMSAVYLAGGTLFAPTLWLDPLGPLIKVLPSVALTLIVWLGMENR